MHPAIDPVIGSTNRHIQRIHETMACTVARAAKQVVFSHFSLVVEISAHLKPNDIVSLEQVCHAIRRIIEQDAFWKLWGEGQNLCQYEKIINQAASEGNLSQVVRLVTAGVDLTSSGGGWTLGNAGFEGHIEIVRFLLEDGRADPTAHRNWAIHMASDRGQTEAVRLLLKDGRADPAAQALIAASDNNRADVVCLLLADSRVDPTAEDNWAILTACRKGYTEVVRHLLEDDRADPEVGLAAAREKGNNELVQLIEDHMVKARERR